MLSVESSVRPKSALRRRWLLLATALMLLASPVFLHGFRHWPRHSAAWVDGQLDAAIERGLNYLHGSYVFLRPLERRGAPALHHYLLNQVIQKHDHTGLRIHLELAARLNQDAGEWRDFYGMPGWINEELTGDDHERIQLITQNSRSPNDALLLHALHPAWTDLSAANQTALFEAPEQFTASSDVCRALLAYHWLKALTPEVAKKRGVEQLSARIYDQLRQIQRRATQADTDYNERAAVWLLTKNPQPLAQRWVERLLANQAADGGWPATTTHLRTLLEMVGWRFSSAEGSPESTLFALVALGHYRDAAK